MITYRLSNEAFFKVAKEKFINVLKTNLQDVRIVETDIFGDHRSFFTETYTKNKFVEAGIDNDFTQDNQSLSVEPGVLRGMHYQLAQCAQTKLLRAITGVIYDVLAELNFNWETKA